MKNIIHMQILFDDNNYPIVDGETVLEYYKHVLDIIGDEYHVIVTPFDTKCLTEDNVIVNIDCKEYTIKEIRDIVDKHKND